MTVSVGQNLKVKELVAETLQSNHESYHHLHKSHDVEALNRSNLDVLATVENQLKFRETLAAINPTACSFLRDSPTVI